MCKWKQYTPVFVAYNSEMHCQVIQGWETSKMGYQLALSRQMLCEEGICNAL